MGVAIQSISYNILAIHKKYVKCRVVLARRSCGNETIVRSARGAFVRVRRATCTCRSCDHIRGIPLPIPMLKY